MRRALTLAALLALAACSAPDGGGGTTGTQSEALAVTDPKSGGAPPVAVAVAQIAYVYKLGFRVPGTAIATVQDAHIALCDTLGPARCQVIAMDRDAGEDSYASASMKLKVSSGIARRFSTALTRAVTAADGRAVDTAIEAEDVSKAIVDTQARLKQRTLLVERLTAVLRTRTGTVAELVEAERSVAQAQEELDQATAWLGELRARVAMSTFELRYTAAAPSSAGIGGRLGDTLAQSGSMVVSSVQALLIVAIFLLPWLVVIVPGAILWRRYRRRKASVPADDAA